MATSGAISTGAKAFPSTTKQRVLLALTTPLVPLFVCLATGVRTMRQRNPAFRLEASSLVPLGSPVPQPVDLAVSLVLALALVRLRSAMIRSLEAVAREVLPPALRTSAFRVDRFATSIFKLVYFSIMVGVGFWLQQDQPWFPPSLGGTGEVSEALATTSRPPSRALRLYMLVELAYLAHNLIFVLLCKPVDDDTMDFVIHDLTSMQLVGAAYLVNHNAIGAVITFLNDTADVGHYLLLLGTDSRRPRAAAAMLLVFVLSWGYTRLVVYPRECLRAVLLNTVARDPYVSMLYLAPTSAMLSLLLGLQIYWYQMLSRKGLRVLRQATCTKATSALGTKA